MGIESRTIEGMGIVGKGLQGQICSRMRRMPGKEQVQTLYGEVEESRTLRTSGIIREGRRIMLITLSLIVFVMAVGVALMFIPYEPKAQAEELHISKIDKRMQADLKNIGKEIEHITTEEVAPFPNYPTYDEIPLDKHYQSYLQMLCKEQNVPFCIALAFIESESTFNPDAVGDSGNSVGFLQINVPNWYRYGLNAFDEYENLEIGVRMLRELLDKYNELDAVTMAYKGGESKADKWIEEGYRLPACDEILNNVMKWEGVIMDVS